jgi:cell division protein FtsB
MNIVEKRKERLRRIGDGLVIMVLLATVGICVSIYVRARSELDAAITKNKTAADRVEGLRIEVERRERDVQGLRSDSRAIETFARQRFGFVRNGDLVIKLPQDREATGVQVATLTPQQADGYTKTSN